MGGLIASSQEWDGVIFMEAATLLKGE